MPSSPFEVERRYLSHPPLRLQLPIDAVNTWVNHEYGTVELTAAATVFQSSEFSLCSAGMPRLANTYEGHFLLSPAL